MIYYNHSIIKDLVTINKDIYINYVFKVVEYGSLTNAARSLHVTQPALSQGISALEKELGFRIFNRGTVPVTMTKEGELFYRYLRRSRVLRDNFKKEIEDTRNSIDSKVTIGSPAVYVQSIIGPTIKRIRNIGALSIKTASVKELLSAAESGDIDCFISTTDNLPANFETVFIRREEIVLCVPNQSHITALSFDQMRNECFINLNNDYPLQIAVNALMEEHGFEPDRKIVIDQVAEAVNLTEQGVGICFASKEAAINRNVRTIPTGISGRDIYIVYDKELYQTKACTDLINAILTDNAQTFRLDCQSFNT